MKRALASLACGFGVSCGLSAVGTGPPTDNAEDAGADAAPPVVIQADGAIMLPEGWSYASVGPAGAPCPSGFDSPADVVGSPVAHADACECGACTLVAPTCAGQWSLDYSYGTNLCDSAGTRTYYMNNPPGSCGTDYSPGDHTGRESKFFGGMPPTGGACNAATVVTHGDRFDVEHAVLCKGQDGTCIAHDGDVACPSPFAAKKTFGDGVDLTCPACSCTKGPSSCVVIYYANSDCTGTAQKMPADGKCNDTGLVGSDSSYRIVGDATCAIAAKAPAASTALKAARTVCCR